MTVNPLSIKKQINIPEDVDKIKTKIKKYEKRIIFSSEEAIDKILFLKNEQLESEGYITLSIKDIQKYKIEIPYKLKADQMFPYKIPFIFCDKKIRNIIMEEYSKNGWMVEYKGWKRKYLKFTPLPKSSSEIKQNKFSNLDID